MPKLVQWHELSQTEKRLARDSDSSCPWLEEPTSRFLKWAGWDKPGESSNFHEDGKMGIQVIHASGLGMYFLLRLGSGRVITSIDTEEFRLKGLLEAEKSQRFRHFMEWVYYWNEFDREQCALERARRSGVTEPMIERIRHEARRLGGWFIRYRPSGDIYEFSKRNGDGLVYYYTGEHFLHQPGPPASSEGDDRGSADCATWQA